ncbi:phosphatidylserine decarboxylase protein [Rutstroemia sp. NJR-2017a BVV2]|nr:phosphatidylserine decarboxylase protein [Rutstroemia sp. NJR-2017a BVV2]
MQISEFIVPSAELLADRGSKHLTNVREITNECWTNSEAFLNPSSGSSSRSGPRLQPDFGFGFDRDAFNSEQLQKLQPFLGDLLTDYSLFAVTYQMYFPFLTCEVNSGDEELDVADRKNAYAQSVALRGLYWLFKLVGRENELHRETSSFSISHNDKNFVFVPSGEGDQRWKAYKFVKNVYDLWLPSHLKQVGSAVDMFRADLDIRAFNLPKSDESSDSDLDSMASGLSGKIESYGIVEAKQTHSLPTNQFVSPEATTKCFHSKGSALS